jgi:hypothetical protein
MLNNLAGLFRNYSAGLDPDFVMGCKMMRADASKPPRTRSSAGPQRDAPAAGARAPDSTLSPEKPDSNTRHNSQNPDGKNPSKPFYLPLRTHLFPSYKVDRGGSRTFSQKNRSFFPDWEPPLFFDHNAPPDLPEVPDNLLISRFFTFKGTRLNCTVFS